MKVSPEARRLAKYRENKKEISVATLQFDVTFCTPILCALSVYYNDVCALRRENPDFVACELTSLRILHTLISVFVNYSLSGK